LTSATESPDHRGCLLVNAATERNAADQRCLDLSSDAIDQLRDVMTAGFEARRHELADGVTPGQAADLVLVAMQGLRVLATTNSSVDANPTVQTVLERLVPENRSS
jgi:hypothetical protein